MRRKLFALAALAALLLSMASPALAIEYGRVYDGTDLLDAGSYSLNVEELVGEISKEMDFEIRVDVVYDLEDYDIDSYAELFYNQYDYGMGPGGTDGSLLMIYAPVDGDSVRFEDFTIYYGGLGQTYFTGEHAKNHALMLEMVKPYLSEAAWSDAQSATDSFWEAVTTYAFSVRYLINDYHGVEVTQNTAQPSGAGTPAITIPQPQPVSAAGNVIDEAKLLTRAQAERLDAWAFEISEKYQCDVIVLTTNDFGNGDWFDTAAEMYAERGFGYGDDSRGIMLLLSMAERDAVLYVEGSAQDAFLPGYGQERIEKRYLEFLRENDFNGAFEQYIYDCALYLEMAVQGTPLTGRNDPYIEDLNRGVENVISIAIPFLVAAIFCLIHKQRMKTAKMQRNATQYIAKDGFRLTGQRDDFLYATETRTKIETKSSGGSSRSSSSSSGRSSKF
jgi:Beta-propeller domains of methanol dehydrogenase type